MKAISKLLVSGALAVASASAAAQSAGTILLTVTGTIKPKACTPSVDNGGFDLNNIDSTRLNPGQETQLPPRSVNFTIHCDSVRTIAFRLIDSRPGSSTHQEVKYLGLGKDKSGHNIGSALLSLSNFRIGLAAAGGLYSTDGGVRWIVEDKPQFVPDPSWFYSFRAAGGNTPAAGQDFSATLSLTPYITNAGALDLTDKIDVDGSAVIVVDYV